MKAIIALPHSFDYDMSAKLVIGVDYGALLLAKKKVEMDYAIGDFDSVTDNEIILINKYSKEVITLNEDKNETDSEAALMLVKSLGDYKTIMLSDYGNRFDHLLNNFRLLNKYDFKLVSEYSEVFKLRKGTHKIKNTHSYLSLFAIDEVTINLKNTKYELNDLTFNESDTYLTSNEIYDEYAIIEILNGELIVVLSSE